MTPSPKVSPVVYTLVCLLLSGCLTDDRSFEQTRQRQQDALIDPFGYNPQVLPPEKPKPSKPAKPAPKGPTSESDGLRKDPDRLVRP